MSKLSIFAVVFLFWVTLSVSLMRVQLTASPVYKMRVPTYRSMPICPAVVAQVEGVAAAGCYN